MQQNSKKQFDKDKQGATFYRQTDAKTSPIIPWMGSKRRLAKHLLPLFPEHGCYVELFAGGAALFFLRDTPARCEVLNDINGDLVNLYHVVQHHFDEFVRQFAWLFSSRQTFVQLPETLRPSAHLLLRRSALLANRRLRLRL